MTQEILDLIRSLRGQGYKLYCALRQTLGTPEQGTFTTWWRLVPRSSRQQIKQAWRARFGLQDRSAYTLFYRLQEQGTISRADFSSWWKMIPPNSRLRILLCWWVFLQRGCHAVKIIKPRGASETSLVIRLTPDSPLVYY